MSASPDRPESDRRVGKHKPEHTGFSRAQHEGYQHHKPQHHHSGEKHLHHVSIHDQSGHHISHMHKVKKGETVWKIAHKELSQHGHHPERKEVNKFARRIMRVNHIEHPKHLKPGSELMIPEHGKHHGRKGERKHASELHTEHGTGKKKHKNRPHDGAQQGPAHEHRAPHERPQHQGGERRRPAARTEAPRRRRGAGRGAPEAAEGPQAPAPRSAEQGSYAPEQPAQYAPEGQGPYVPAPQGPYVTMPDGRRVVAASDPGAQRGDAVPYAPAPRPESRPDAGDRPPVQGSGVLSGRTFVIDPGHGLQDSGAFVNGVKEKDLVLPYAALLGRKLQALGANVVYTRPIDRDAFSSLEGRTQIANQAHPDAVIRIHANDDVSHRAQGMETYWMDPKDQRLAQMLHSSILQAEQGQTQDRGVRHKDFKMHPTAPSALVELGYMSDRNELMKLMRPAFRNAAVDGMVNGLVRFVNGLGPKSPQEPRIVLQERQRPTEQYPQTSASIRPENLAPLSPTKKTELDRAYQELNYQIRSGQLQPNPAGIVPVYRNGGEVYNEAALQWAINRQAEAAPPNVSANDMPFTGPSTVSARGFLDVLRGSGSYYANRREDVRVRREDGSIANVSLDMGQLAKLYEVKWRQQGNIPLNAGALLAQSAEEIKLANLNEVSGLHNGAAERIQATNQWAGIKTGKNTFRCEASETNWGQVANPQWSAALGSSVWADKKETRVWQTPGKSMCGWFEHIGEKYVATGKDTAGKIIPQYVGNGAGPHYMQGFADKMRRFADVNRYTYQQAFNQEW